MQPLWSLGIPAMHLLIQTLQSLVLQTLPSMLRMQPLRSLGIQMLPAMHLLIQTPQSLVLQTLPSMLRMQPLWSLGIQMLPAMHLLIQTRQQVRVGIKVAWTGEGWKGPRQWHLHAAEQI